MFEEIIIIGFSIAIGLYLTVFVTQSFKSKKTKDAIYHLCEKHGKLTRHNQKDYLEINGTVYQLLFFYVPGQAELTINSRTIWEIKSASKSNLINQSIFLSSDKPKIVVIYPSSSAIKRFINENELVFVNFNEPFYNMYVVRQHDLEKLLSAGIL